MLSYISPTSTPPPPSPSLTSHSLLPTHLQPANSHPRFSPRASPNVSPGSSPRLRAVGEKSIAAAGSGFAKFDGSEGSHKVRRPVGMNRLASIAAIPSSSGGAGLSNSVPYGFNFGTGFGFSPENAASGMDRKDSLDTMFDYESEGLIFPAKRMDGLEPALRELVEILMGDVESSGSEGESDGEDDGLNHEMEMEDDHPTRSAEGKNQKRHSVASSTGAPEREREPEPGIGIRSGRRKSRIMEMKMRPAAKGWRKGVAKESVKIQLMVDLPCWEPGCYNDLSSMHALRDKTLQALHVVVDALTIRGIRTTYRLHSTANGGAWGCIRVAPVLGSKLPLQRGQIDAQASISKDKENDEQPALSMAAATPSSLLSIRRSTLANPGNKGMNSLSTSWNEKSSAQSVEAARKEREREIDEKERVAKRVKRALEQDGQGIVEEYRSYLLAINGQPALVLT